MSAAAKPDYRVTVYANDATGRQLREFIALDLWDVGARVAWAFESYADAGQDVRVIVALVAPGGRGPFGTPGSTPSTERGAWTCGACGFRGFWSGGAHDCEGERARRQGVRARMDAHDDDRPFSRLPRGSRTGGRP